MVGLVLGLTRRVPSIRASTMVVGRTESQCATMVHTILWYYGSSKPSTQGHGPRVSSARDGSRAEARISSDQILGCIHSPKFGASCTLRRPALASVGRACR